MIYMIILKIGGCILTNKDAAESEIDEKNLSRIAKEIKSSLDNDSKEIIIVHGAGSFGHPPAKEYKIGEPFDKDEYPQKRIGFSKTQNAVKRLNMLICDEFIKEDLPVVAVPASSFMVATNKRITEDLIIKVHNLVIGKNQNAKATYRDGQNIVEDSLTKQIVYMPPEAKDIKALINQMIKEFDNKTSKDIPIPIKAGIIEYEFVTIHPFWDGNGRTSRLLANYILKAYGYDLKGFYVMEEFYDKNINDYYNSLQMGIHHNFYFGRKDADITEWLEYFISTMANTFEAVGN